MQCNGCVRESQRALVARSLEVGRQELYRWSRDVDEFGERAFPGVGQKRAEETRIAELERKIGQQVLEIDFLKRALQHVDFPQPSDRRRRSSRSAASRLETVESIESMCDIRTITIAAFCVQLSALLDRYCAPFR